VYTINSPKPKKEFTDIEKHLFEGAYPSRILSEVLIGAVGFSLGGYALKIPNLALTALVGALAVPSVMSILR